jgi:hypothetical protein
VRGPDPKEFEAEFTIGDEDESSRSGTPQLATTGAASEVGANEESAEMEGKTADEPEKEAQEKDPKEVKEISVELPPDVRAKLRRLDKLESRYHGMQLPKSEQAGPNTDTTRRIAQGLSHGSLARPLHRTL